MLRFAQHDRRFLHTFCAFPESTSGIVRSRLRLNRRRVASPKNQKLDCRQSESREPVKKSAPVILSEAKDPRSFPWFNNLRTTAEILRCAQDDTFRISSHVQRLSASQGGKAALRAANLDSRRACATPRRDLRKCGDGEPSPYSLSTPARDASRSSHHAPAQPPT
jgi:hypothetical protein